MSNTHDEEDRLRLLPRAREYFLQADNILALYRTASGAIDVLRLARTLMDDRTCETLGIDRLTRQVLVLAAMIELRKQQVEKAPRRNEEYERIERDLMEWNSKSLGRLTTGDLDDVEIAFSFVGVLLGYCDPTHWRADLIADYASEGTRWAINNACLCGDLMIRKYIRKWELGRRRFLPWYGNPCGELGLDWLRKAAELGNVVAQRQFAECYAAGKGVVQNDALAARWYRGAAEQGDRIAQHLFGYYCAQGRGVSQDRVEAIKWYRASAERGFGPAQYNLGNCYYYGTGVEQDAVEAARWFRKAAEQGLPEAQSNFGRCHYEGRGVPQNYSRAVEYYQMAANQGYAEAQYNLATCCCDGLGVSQDYIEAYKWLSLIPIGRLFGRLECARKLRDELASKMTSEQIAEARRRAAALRKSSGS